VHPGRPGWAQTAAWRATACGWSRRCPCWRCAATATIFQDKNARDIVTELLMDYPQQRFDFDITQELSDAPVCTQYRESDLAFFTRLLASEGLSWRFEHDQAGHRLVIFDGRSRRRRHREATTIRFHGVRATEQDDSIDGFTHSAGSRRMA
jgi:type VI secretion system secreted protein VgrG